VRRASFPNLSSLFIKAYAKEVYYYAYFKEGPYKLLYAQYRDILKVLKKVFSLESIKSIEEINNWDNLHSFICKWFYNYNGI